MWPDGRKRRTVTFKVNEMELWMIKDMAENLGVDESEAIRRAIYAHFVLYDPKLKASDALKLPVPDNATLAEALRPIFELYYHLGIPLRLYRNRVYPGPNAGPKT